jgi:glycosyltransferase involved in cell wall biosynthesis
MRTANTKISIIIPVYNEETQIVDCLTAIKQQTVSPLEVIVVDNNSTDNTIALVKTFSGVTIINERKQGQRFAQITGMNRASGDILLRIDADTILFPKYLETLDALANSHPDIAGFTGYGVSRYEFIPKISIPWSWMYFIFTSGYFGYSMLWGANMAIRKEYWDSIKHALIVDDVIHEDQDLSLALARFGGKTKVFSALTTSVQMEAILHFRRYHLYMQMLTRLKRLDAAHPRSNNISQVRKISAFRRFGLLLISGWAIYVFYVITILYSLLCLVKNMFTTRLFLADRPQDS